MMFSFFFIRTYNQLSSLYTLFQNLRHSYGIIKKLIYTSIETGINEKTLQAVFHHSVVEN